MAAYYTRIAPWPGGTTVAVYEAGAVVNGVASGPPFATTAVRSDGSLLLLGLTAGARYTLVGSGLVEDFLAVDPLLTASSIVELQADVAALEAGTDPFDAVTVVNADTAPVTLQDTGAVSGRQAVQLHTDGGTTQLRALNDSRDAALLTFLSCNHATGSVAVPAGKLLADPEAITAATLVGAWVAGVGYPVGFYKHMGRVYLEGRAFGAVDTVAFALPGGYRPSVTRQFVVPNASNTTSRVDVQANGDVYVRFDAFPIFDGISFRAEA